MLIETARGFIKEPEELYHSKRKDYLSSHQLGDFRKSPSLFIKKRKGLVPDKDTSAYNLGRATHKLILEKEEKFHEDYAVGGPINDSTGKPYGSTTKKFQEWKEALGKEVITEDEFELIQKMNEGVQANEHACKLLETGIAEGVIRTNYCQMPCQIRMDFFSFHNGLIDLKTCQDLDKFEWDSIRFGYIHQLAFYRAVLGAFQSNSSPVHLIAIEKQEPYRCGVWRVGEKSLFLAEKENTRAIQEIRNCMEDGVWPTRYEEIRELNFNNVTI